MKSVRVWFKKTGLSIYTSHLDMNRCFSRAVVRAHLPLWYTEGFNPKPYLNFLAPLPLGQEGLNEPLDIRIEGEISNEEIKSRLSAVMPQGIEITAVTEPVMKTAEITAAKYRVKLTFADENEAAAFCRTALSMVASGEISAEKRSKRGVKTVNLCEMIYSFEAAAVGNDFVAEAVLPCGSTLNLNPDLLLDCFYLQAKTEPQHRTVSRIALLNAERKDFC